MTDEWKEQANCWGMDPGLFYSTTQTYPLEAQEACQNCAVRGDCYKHALKFEDYGFWAGTTERDRRRTRVRLGITLMSSPSPLKSPQSHGTYGGYRKHLAAHEEACRPCLDANARTKMDNTRRRMSKRLAQGDQSEAEVKQAEKVR